MNSLHSCKSLGIRILNAVLWQKVEARAKSLFIFYLRVEIDCLYFPFRMVVQPHPYIRAASRVYSCSLTRIYVQPHAYIRAASRVYTCSLMRIFVSPFAYNNKRLIYGIGPWSGEVARVRHSFLFEFVVTACPLFLFSLMLFLFLWWFSFVLTLFCSHFRLG